MKKTGFYIIKDEFFEDMSDPYLKGNKDGNRPHYYCLEDRNAGIYWMIPLSSRIDKYTRIIDKKEKAGKPFHEYNMDLDTLIGYEEYGRKLTGNDRKRLEELARQYPQWEETIRYMLEHNVKIEQECIGASVVLDSAEQ